MTQRNPIAADPAASVTAFLDVLSEEGLAESFHRWFTPATVWENVGLVTTTGVEESLAMMDRFAEQSGLAGIRIETLAIAAQGNTVLTERVDYMVDGDGAVIVPLRLMGVFDLDADGRIIRWSDYFDVAGFREALASASQSAAA